MKNIIILAVSVIISSAPLMAQNLESLRKSSENMDIQTGTLKKQSATKQYEISPTPVFARLIINFFKLLFSPNGDIEIENPSTEVPQVDGVLEDDIREETYSETATYAPIDPADLEEEPASLLIRQPQQPMRQKTSFNGGDSGLPQDLKQKALNYFNANQDKIKNKKYIGIVDFSAHSSKQRFFILDMESGAVHAIHVAHGTGSDPDGDGFATKFSNVPNSRASSLGFYVTGALYTGSHGRSMRLHGLSSTNSNALSRAVVLHEAVYVREANMRQGRSWGCLAVSATEIRKTLNSLKGGALIYAGLRDSDF
ncbi:MAG: hypothetical protein COX65_07340 [Elusimicrobia bacterium CG_4_10_14_0_2_um_filter_56_8]|nr:MAG: hypothetical protein AUJ51_04675 [Elusimicrobia bacterium CG1_02_56_21]PJA13364.1 MAG: hypothetical protein COX65_07340 [Elusimicrobia bacterium CG_4_10_14_0_2_um_filter_56_8]